MGRLNTWRPLAVFGLLALALVASAGIAAAASTVVVTQNSSTWGNMDTRPGGASLITNAYGAPAGLGVGALELKTDATNAAKADYWTFAHAGTPLANVNDLAYWTYQAPAVPVIAAVSYQLQINVNGSVTPGAPGFATLVFEPYQSGIAGNPAIVSGVWQSWDVDSGKVWSTRTLSVGTCILTNGAGGPPFYTLATLKTICPAAVILGVGVNIGSYNPNYTVATDGVQFNGTTYDFELASATTTTVTFGPGPFVANGSAYTATASVSPAAAGTATIVYTGDCVNAGTSCTATATYAGNATYLGSSATTSIVITLPVATSGDQCKQGGWQTLTDHIGAPFKNQGDCVSYVATAGKNKGAIAP